MTTEKEAKNLALKLYLQGESTDEIALECGVTRRTIQRWIKEFERTPINLTVQENVTDEKQEDVRFEKQESVRDEKQNVSENIKQEIIPVLETIVSHKRKETLDLKITSKLAIKLLSLTELAMESVENCLADPDTKTADKLKAAQLVGNWVGLDSQESILKKLIRNFEVEVSIVDSDTADTALTPSRLAETERRQQQERQWALDLASELYTDEVCNEFISTEQLPTTFDESFDWDRFWEFLEKWDERENTQYVEKAKLILNGLDDTE